MCFETRTGGIWATGLPAAYTNTMFLESKYKKD